MGSALDTFLSPVILFFVLGVVAALARSDLAFPEALTKGLSLYLMAAIGLQGGIKFANAGLTADAAFAIGAGILLSFALPWLIYPPLRRIGGVGPVDAGAIAAHYGSVSVVTYTVGAAALEAGGMPPAGYMVAVLALMETPAIVSGLMLARRGSGGLAGAGGGHLWREVFLNGSVVLLVGAFLIGAVAGPARAAPVMPLFEELFRGALCLFLLDMGLLAARRLRDSRGLTGGLVALALMVPIVNGTIGVLIGTLVGLDPGSAAALSILAASASYIAVPAAMRLALPEADPGRSLGMSLGITFPFNVLIGIPFFSFLARSLA